MENDVGGYSEDEYGIYQILIIPAEDLREKIKNSWYIAVVGKSKKFDDCFFSIEAFDYGRPPEIRNTAKEYLRWIKEKAERLAKMSDGELKDFFGW